MYHGPLTLLFCIFLIVSMSAGPSPGDTHYAAPGGANVFPYTTWTDAAKDIQSAVNAADNGDMVLVSNGTYALSQQIKITKHIVLKSVNGAASTIVDGGNATRCIYILKSSATIDGFTITRGFSPQDGGGIYIYTPARSNVIANCMIKANKAFNSYGGGIYVRDSACDMHNTVISSNTAWREGGGLYWKNGSGLVSSVYFIGNQSIDGGAGTALDKSNPLIRGCHFIKNKTTGSGGNGGGLSCSAGSSPVIQDCRFELNSAWGGFDWLAGGGLFCADSDPVVQNCVFTGNVAKVGGGIGGFNSSPVIQGCDFFYNQAYDMFFDGFGGGIFLQKTGAPRIVDCLFENNYADDSGGAVAFLQMDNSGGEMQRCMLRFNATGFGAGGGIACIDSSPLIANSALVSNRTDTAGINNDLYAWGSGVYVEQNTDYCPTIRNVTLSFNSKGNQLPYQANNLWCQKTSIGSASATVLRNSVIWDGSIILVSSQDGSPALDVDYSDIYGGPNGFTVPAWVLYGGSNIDKDPEFISEGWRIESGSSCVDIGDKALVTPGETDLDGDPRVLGASVEQGADEVE